MAAFIHIKIDRRWSHRVASVFSFNGMTQSSSQQKSKAKGNPDNRSPYPITMLHPTPLIIKYRTHPAFPGPHLSALLLPAGLLHQLLLQYTSALLRAKNLACHAALQDLAA